MNVWGILIASSNVNKNLGLERFNLSLKLQSPRLSNELFPRLSSSWTWEIDTAFLLYVSSALFLVLFEPDSECVLHAFIDHPIFVHESLGYLDIMGDGDKTILVHWNSDRAWCPIRLREIGNAAL